MRSVDQRDRPAVLAVFAHPDDETLTAGGLMAHLSRTHAVHLITATRGELGEQLGPMAERTRTDPAALARTRIAELTQAATALGVASQQFLDELSDDDGPGYTDSGMSWADSDRRQAIAAPTADRTAFSRCEVEPAAQLLAAEIIRLRPQLVLTEESGGGYGHPDHVQSHAVTVRAVELAAPDWPVPVVAAVVRAAASTIRAQRWLADHPDLPRYDDDGEMLHPPDLEAPQISGVHEQVDATIDISEQLDPLIAAMGAHRTQVHAITQVPRGRDAAGWFALSNNDLQPILTHAALVLLPGGGTQADLKRILTAPRQYYLHQAPVSPGTRWAFAGFGAAGGVLAGLIGTVSHRSFPPWGIVLAFALLYAGMVFSRTLGQRWATYGFGIGALAAVLAITSWRPGDDVLIVQDALGLTWLGGVFLAILAGMLIPKSWLANQPRPAPSLSQHHNRTVAGEVDQ